MKHRAKLIATKTGEEGKVYFGSSGSPDREESLAIAHKAATSNTNVQKYLAYLESISGSVADAKNTKLESADCCAEPHAILRALAANEDPRNLRFVSIERQETVQPGEEPSSQPGSAKFEWTPAPPCLAFCGKYIHDNIVQWGIIEARYAEIAASKQKLAAIKEKDEEGFMLDAPGRLAQKKKLTRQAKQTLAKNNIRATEKAKEARYRKSNTTLNAKPAAASPSNTNQVTPSATTPKPPVNKEPSWADIVKK